MTSAPSALRSCPRPLTVRIALPPGWKRLGGWASTSNFSAPRPRRGSAREQGSALLQSSEMYPECRSASCSAGPEMQVAAGTAASLRAPPRFEPKGSRPLSRGGWGGPVGIWRKSGERGIFCFTLKKKKPQRQIKNWFTPHTVDTEDKAFGNQLWKKLAARRERHSRPGGGPACGAGLTFCHPLPAPSFDCAVVFAKWGCPPALLPGAWPWPWPWPWPWCKLTFTSLGWCLGCAGRKSESIPSSSSHKTIRKNLQFRKNEHKNNFCMPLVEEKAESF